MKPLRMGISLRIGLALFCTLASMTLAYVVLVGEHQSASAAPGVSEISSQGADPWGISFGSNGNAWIAEPACDPGPYQCSGSTNGTPSIAQLNRSTFTIAHTYSVPQGYSSPFFTAEDAQGNVWFSEPDSDSIGEFIPGSASWRQWHLPTANAAPFDLAFDNNGNLWFTEVVANKIGEFIPSNQSFNETPTPTANSNPYGIVGPDPTTGQMWFTENAIPVARIGSFVPPASGALSTSNIKEYLTNSGSSSPTPHLITYDQYGNIWWTEGPDRDIGQLVISQVVPGTKNGVTEYTVPYPSSCPGGCAMHISGIGVDSSGTVWFDDSLTSRIGSFNPSTKTFSMLPSLAGGAHPHDGLAVDGNNNVYVSEEFANKIAKVTTGVLPPSPGPTGTVSTPPHTPSGPVNKTWYFAEGRVGKGFREYLTIDNPAATTCSVNIQYNYTPDGGSPANKTVTVSVNSATRLTESVNNDLGYLDSSPTAASLATVVSVNSSVTPNCVGVVVERPMYFVNFRGISSGTDVLGSTHLSTSYYFADVPTGSNNNSYLTILNPNNVSATVTVTYYYAGNAVGSQNTTVNANARGTIAPGAISLPSAHLAVLVTSNQPIMVERPTYFIGASVNGASVSGAYDIVGVPSLASDWLFAEGYTSSTTQENLTIANIDPAKTAASVTITLKSKTGATHATTVSVSAQTQTIWNVNANNNFSGFSPEVSIEVVSSGAKIVVQREMYFTYKHTLPNGRVTQANGGTDVIGQLGPATHSSYSFAEGYSNNGYNEWLTIQNPTNAAETITLTMMNGLGQSNTQVFTVGANSRYTQDISALVQNATIFNAGINSAANSVSMTVQSTSGAVFVVERPMYWSTNGVSPFITQGGSDVIGYVGG